MLDYYDSSFDKGLDRNKDDTIHMNKNLCLRYAKETAPFRRISSIETVLLNNFKNKLFLHRFKTRANKYGNESLTCGGSIVWNRPSDQYKAAKSDNEFEMKVRSWKGTR